MGRKCYLSSTCFRKVISRLKSEVIFEKNENVMVGEEGDDVVEQERNCGTGRKYYSEAVGL